MQIKHTFLFTLILGLVWTSYLFGYITGPEPGRNGIFGAANTCAVVSCHVGNPVNSTVGNGSVTLAFFPAGGWTPGQVPPLTVTVARTGAQIFGFQLSAVADSNNSQAGTLAAGNARVRIVCGRVTNPNVEVPCSTAGTIQYAEHVNATVVTSTYTVNWTAPADAGFGTVRFNVAGNAGNGDQTPNGDFIYTRAVTLDPAVTTPPGVSSVAYTMVDRGGVSLITDGAGSFNAGYARIQPNASNTTPSGVAIFGLQQGGTVVTEAGVPASPLLTTGRIPAEVTTTTVNTGIAIANPNGQDAVISFSFTDGTGADFGANSLTIPANSQIASFLNESPFNVLAGRGSFLGTFSFTSNVPVSVIALRGLYNERAVPDFLITTLPITNLAAAPATGTVFLPHFAEGTGWSTQIVLVNPTDAVISGSIQFFASTGGPQSVTPAGGQSASSFSYSIPRRSSFKLATSGTAPSLLSGSVRVVPGSGTSSPSAVVVFSFKPAGITVSEAGVPGNQGTSFRGYAEETAIGGVGAIQSGLAIANTSGNPADVTLTLTNLDGSAAQGQSTAQLTIPANGQMPGFLHDFFPGLTLPFKGVVRITTTSASGISVVGLRGRYNQRGDFLITTTPPTNEAGPPSSAEQLFPHLINGDQGGGSIWTTQFILFSGTAGQAVSGNLRFFKQNGSPFNLTLQQ